MGNQEAIQRYGLAVASHLLLVAVWHFFVVFGEVPANAGVLEPIEFVIDEGSILAARAPKPEPISTGTPPAKSSVPPSASQPPPKTQWAITA